MNWENFLEIAGKLPVIDTENLCAGVSNPVSIEVQISRWKKAGRIIQLKRGKYLLAEPYRKIEVYEPYIASVLKMPSYISMEKALEYHDLIPEAVTVYTSVTTKRQGRFVSKAGIFEYRHIKEPLFWGYTSVTVSKQTAFIASPEKALLDFFYLERVPISLDYLEGLRLQNVGKIAIEKLFEYARRFKKPRMLYVAQAIKEYTTLSKRGEKVL
jgi:predicted transcriptional regulator of viral defense system